MKVFVAIQEDRANHDIGIYVLDVTTDPTGALSTLSEQAYNTIEDPDTAFATSQAIDDFRNELRNARDIVEAWDKLVQGEAQRKVWSVGTDVFMLTMQTLRNEFDGYVGP